MRDLVGTPGGRAGERGKMIGRRHKGRVNQPNNHSKLTDSNNCTVLFLVSTLLLLFATPLLPVSSAGHPPHVVDRRQGQHVKRVAERRATYLRDNDFCVPPATPRGRFGRVLVRPGLQKL